MYYNTINDYINANVKTARAIIDTLPEPQKEIVTNALEWLAWKYEESMKLAKAMEDATIDAIGNEAYAKIMNEVLSSRRCTQLEEEDDEQETGEDC